MQNFNPMSEPTWGQENVPWEVNIEISKEHCSECHCDNLWTADLISKDNVSSDQSGVSTICQKKLQKLHLLNVNFVF